MALFLGKFEYVIDEKGRVNIPAKFRDLMGEDPTLAAIKGMDGCIFVFPLPTLDAFRGSFDRSHFKSKDRARRFQRLLADGGSTSQPDTQGRITLTEEQRRHAGLKRDVAIFGNFERIEIWDRERLRLHLAGPEDQDTDQEQEINDLASIFFGEGDVKEED